MATYDLNEKLLTNLLQYGSFENTGWTGSGSYSTTYKKYGSYSRQVLGTSSGEVFAYHSGGAKLVQGHKYYFRVEVYHTGVSGSMDVYFPEAEPNLFAGRSLGPANQWNVISHVNDRTNWADNAAATVRIDYNNGGATTSIYLDGAMLIDLTAYYGAGNEPTKEWCDENLPFFIGSLAGEISGLSSGDILNCGYSGSASAINLPAGKYKLECWGAQGGYRSSSTYGGMGGYSVGTLTLAEAATLYLYVGGSGNSGKTAGGFNGGGSRTSYNGGGGGTDIRIGTDSLYARVIVAGGGGSDGATNKNGMYGGGDTGGSATQSYGSGGGGGTQTAGGTGGSGNAGTFGVGGQGLNRSSGYAGAGGGGWYGGGGSYPDGSGDDDRGGGGGSGYVYTSSTYSNYPSGCLLNSAYYLTEASTTAGNVSFTSPTGTAETGHAGDGYIRITAIEVSSLDVHVNVNSAWKKLDKMYSNIGGTWYSVELVNSNINNSWKG